MTILNIAIIIFLVLETLNVLMLYFMPGSQMGNGLGVFNAFEKSKADADVHELVKYLINWVAGTKIIFIALLLVILITGGPSTKIIASAAMIISIASFYWRLFPAIRKIDKAGGLTPAGYSKTLGIMIAGFIGIFTIALIVSLIVSAAG